MAEHVDVSGDFIDFGQCDDLHGHLQCGLAAVERLLCSYRAFEMRKGLHLGRV